MSIVDDDRKLSFWKDPDESSDGDELFIKVDNKLCTAVWSSFSEAFFYQGVPLTFSNMPRIVKLENVSEDEYVTLLAAHTKAWGALRHVTDFDKNGTIEEFKAAVRRLIAKLK